MAEEQERAESIENRREVGEKDHEDKQLGAGSEPTGGAPKEHTHEHQSQYGGGGKHGGVK